MLSERMMPNGNESPSLKELTPKAADGIPSIFRDIPAGATCFGLVQGPSGQEYINPKTGRIIDQARLKWFGVVSSELASAPRHDRQGRPWDGIAWLTPDGSVVTKRFEPSGPKLACASADEITKPSNSILAASSGADAPTTAKLLAPPTTGPLDEDERSFALQPLVGFSENGSAKDVRLRSVATHAVSGVEATNSEVQTIDDQPGAPHTSAEVPGERPFALTVFPDLEGKLANRHTTTWPAFFDTLREPVVTTEKSALPLFKLATFGDVRSRNGSLRHDANVLEITGIVADYDGEEMPVQVAVKKLEHAGVRAILYTTPTHTPERPRFRIIAALSKSMPPSAHDALVARINGVLGGVLANESFVLSQAYFYGQVEGSTYECHATFDDPLEGTCIDLLDQLDEIAIGRGGTRVGADTKKIAILDRTQLSGGTSDNSEHPNATSHTDAPKATEAEQSLKTRAEGCSISVIDKHADETKKEFVDGTQLAHLESALECIPADEYDMWVKIGHALCGLQSSHDPQVGRDLWMRWSSKSVKYNADEAAKKWDTFCGNRSSFTVVFAEAQRRGWANPLSNSTAKRRALGAGKSIAVDDDPKIVYKALAAKIATASDDEIENLLDEIHLAKLPAFRVDSLLKSLKEKFKAPITALRADLKRLRDEDADNATNRDHREWAELAIDRFGQDEILFANDLFWCWKMSGVWQRVGEREIKKVIQDVIGDEQAVLRNLVDNVLDVMKTELACEDPFDRAGWTRVNVANGTLELTDNRWMLRAHDKRDFLTTQLPVAFDETATCPRFSQFLDEIFDGDIDRKEKAQVVMEMIGYTLLTTTRFEKFALLIGQGANGKSVLLSVVEALVGRKYVAAVQPSKFEQPFQRAHLHGKLANIVTEIAEGAEIADAQLKAIVSGELTTAEHKFRPPFDFKPYATCWFGTNHMPRTRDFSGALFRRAIVLSFNNTFGENSPKRDPHLKDKLEAELPGILLNALRAIAGVLQRGSFTTPESSRKATEEWRRESDSIAQFLDEECTTCPQNQVASGHLFERYREWAQSSGVQKTVSHRQFTERLERLGFAKGRSGRVRYIVGLALLEKQPSVRVLEV